MTAMKLLAPALLLAMASAAAGDTLRLKNGSTLEGRVIESGDTYVVEMDFGRVTVKKDDVAKVTFDHSAIQRLDEKTAATKMDDAGAVYKLAVWAKENDLGNHATKLFKKAVEVDPDHAGARAELGYRRHEGRWLLEDDYFAATGKVRFRGAWVMREEADRIQAGEQEARNRQSNETRVTEATAKLLEAQADLARAEAAAERVRAEVAQASKAPVVRYVYLPAASTLHYHYCYGVTYSCGCSKGAAPAPKPPACTKK